MQKNRSTYLIIIFSLFFSIANGQNNDERMVRNIATFGKIAGYLQFFSASDAAQTASWDNIYINGTKSVRDCKDDKELLDSLCVIFFPIEPALIFQYNDEKFQVAPHNKEMGQFKFYKQNKGLDLGSDYTNAFKSIRLKQSLAQKKETREIPLTDTTVNEPASIFFHTKLGAKEDLKLSVSEGENIVFSTKITDQDSTLGFRVLKSDIGKVLVFLSVDEETKLDISDFGFSKENADKSIKLDSTALKTLRYTLSFSRFDPHLYENSLDFTDSCHIDLSENFWFKFPLCLSGDSLGTFPRSDLSNYHYDDTKNVGYFSDYGLEHEEVRIANLLRIWNVFNFSYAYLKVGSEQNEKILNEMISSTLANKSVDEYIETVWSMLRAYSDGHIFMRLAPHIEARMAYSIPIEVIKIAGSFYVKDIYDSKYENVIHVGDEILAINDTAVSEVYQNLLKRISGSLHNRSKRAVDRLFDGPKDSPLVLKVKSSRVGSPSYDTMQFTRHEDSRFNLYGHSGYLERANGFIDTNLYYFDLSRNKFDEILLDDIAKTCKNIIFDLRGYLEEPDYSKIISAMTYDTISVKRMSSPLMIRPDSIRWETGEESYTPKPSNLSKANIFFLAGSATQSAPETILELVKSFELAKIIGEPTSGANGNMNFLDLPGNMMVTFSGIRFLNSDGSTHHNIGVIPDYQVDFTLQNIVKREDPYIMKVKEIISEKH